jgi:type IV pilus assembly protein PilC
MPSFVYEARDSDGRPQEGALQASSATAAVDELRGRGWLVLDVRDDSSARPEEGIVSLISPARWLPARSLDVELSLRQMAMMLQGGLTLLTALREVAQNAERAAMGRTWREVSERIQEGASLADAMSHHRRFSPMVVHLARMGEETGELASALTRAAKIMEHRRLLRTSILTALAYPTLVLVAAIGVSGFMALSVIPKLERFLSTIGRRLPAMTQMLLDISRGAQEYAPHVALGLAVFVAVGVALCWWPPGRLWMDRLVLRVPLAGAIVRLAGTAWFATALAALLQSGITLLEGLRTVERLQRNRFLALQVAGARQAVIRGGNLAAPLKTRHAFMPLLSSMVAVGEAAGTLDEVLEEVARFYESQLQATIRRSSIIIEPIIIVAVGGIVGFVYIAFFVALFAAGGGG